MAELLDGNRVRDEIKAELLGRVQAIRQRFRAPGIAVVLVGDNPASAIYVRNKVKTCQDLGIYSETHTPPASIATAELLALVEQLNQREDIDGILVQMPLPPQVDAKRVLDAIRPDKDVDGFHPVSVGNLSIGNPGPRACTPAGVIELLKRYQVPLVGAEVVVVGRSDIVGKPMAMMLIHESATVTVCHSKTRDLAEVCRRADLLIAAMGKPALLNDAHIKPGAVVVDVGMNRVTHPAEVERIWPGDQAKRAQLQQKGSVLVGDVSPLSMAARASFYTPVPGGVGPLTIAMLMVNTVTLAEARAHRAGVLLH
ncbi:MAG: bifunctional methylenetetrahydrofolate dehydrogenase/methenyltetrahydrofolate cyclohydrolase FolD [Bryobacterales bacterium]|jgi:methylenetetrahydrofolate dehydrogenase (NADP+)/methenyltetrahydrofolate cyclohydrolase|nr:bifunctional methylenetetrahydrofolate dehydrogenase/methenyltetrahydrofolate cyclohydrolase FolD [Bryobacterales bacterium]